MRGIGQVSLQSIGWGTSFVDFDSDGWLDLVVANGSTFETKQRPAKLEPMPSFLFWSQQGEFLHDLAPWNVALSTPHASRGLAVADFNNDGAMDIAIVDHGEGVRLLRNDIPQGNWLELRLHSLVGRSRQPVGFGDGATVIADVGGVKLRRTVTSAYSAATKNPLARTISRTAISASALLTDSSAAVSCAVELAEAASSKPFRS